MLITISAMFAYGLNAHKVNTDIKNIVPWATTAICFILWRRATRKTYDSPVDTPNKVKRYI